jgi:glycosyltransferase involved in cell wall biosynthesis/UDP-2,3-diacylglucosamine pyrophosphatase LpxH
MKPRIAKITGTFGTEVQNGVGRFLSGLHKWSDAQGFPLHVFSSGEHIRNYPGVENVHALSFPVPGGFKAIEGYYPLEGRRKELDRALRVVNPDIVHLSTPDPVGMTGLRIARKHRRPVAAIYHTDFPSYARHIVYDVLRRLLDKHGSEGLSQVAFGPVWQRIRPIYYSQTRFWERWVLGYVFRSVWTRQRREIERTLRDTATWIADAVYAVVRETMAQFYGQCQLVIARSEVYREKLIKELCLPEEHVRTLRCGVDTTTFSPTPTEADLGLRDRLGIPAHAKVVLHVGRVTDEKNIGFLADSWRAYRDLTPGSNGSVLLVAGSGNIEEFQKRAGNHVHMLGPCHGATLSAVYRLADVFWTASINETLGQVVLEAQASGIPTLVSDQGAVKENVRDGETGRVLPTDSPARWANELRRLLSDREQLKKMGNSARVHAEGHTIESSYQHYWALHEELLERSRARRKFKKNGDLKVRVFDSAEAPPPEGDQPTTHLSDFHIGKRSKRIPKEAALRAACRRGAERGARFFIHGDFLDTRPPLHKFCAEIAVVRKTLDEFGIRPELYLEGNHDYEFARSRQIEGLLGFPVAPSLVHRDDPTGLVLTHGHVSELPGIQNLLKTIRSREELIDALSVDRLKDTLKLSAFQYDLVGVVTKYLEEAGLQGLEDAWRRSYDGRRWLADRLMELARERSLDDHTVKTLIHMIGSSDREHVLAQLCAALGGWGIVSGHTHEPHVTKHRVADPVTGQQRTVLLGNCGSFRRKTVPPTWIETAFPKMELWAFDAKHEKAQLIDRVSLND